MVRALQSILQEGIDLQKTMKRFPPEAVKARVMSVTLDKVYMETMMLEAGIQSRERYPELAQVDPTLPISMSWVRKNGAMPALWIFETLIEFITEADPTTKKAYVFDLFRIWMGDKDFLIEDIGKVGEELEVIVDARNSGFFRRLTPQQLSERRGQRIAEFIENGENLRYITVARDIGRIAEDITYLTQNDPAVMASRAELARQEEESILRASSAKIIHDTSRFKVVMPFDPAGAMFYGRQTRWCTASKKQNQFGRYMAKNFLFIIFDRAKGKKSQIAVPRDIEFLPSMIPELARALGQIFAQC